MEWRFKNHLRMIKETKFFLRGGGGNKTKHHYLGFPPIFRKNKLHIFKIRDQREVTIDTSEIQKILLLLLLSCFSRVQLCATPQTAAHQAPPSWDSLGKSTGVGCHFLLQCMKVESESEVAQSCQTLRDPMDPLQPTRLLHPWSFQAQVLE